MRELWTALVARLVYILTPRGPQIAAPPQPPLKPGGCECGHLRCSHDEGRGRCRGSWPPDEKNKDWTGCSCVLYIYDPDEDDDDPDSAPCPSPEELERMYK
jgi:hypothetical protein